MTIPYLSSDNSLITGVMHEHLEDLWYNLRQVDLELIYMTIPYLSSDNSLITGVMHEHLEDLWYYLRQVDLELIYSQTCCCGHLY